MKPHSLNTIQLVPSPAKPGPLVERHGYYPKGTVLPETQIPFCRRVKMSDLPPGFVPAKFYEKNLEHNQLVAHCCRHPENHEVEARKSHPDEKAPDIYIFHCTCGRKHIRWLLGTTDDVARPIWS